MRDVADIGDGAATIGALEERAWGAVEVVFAVFADGVVIKLFAAVGEQEEEEAGEDRGAEDEVEQRVEGVVDRIAVEHEMFRKVSQGRVSCGLC